MIRRAFSSSRVYKARDTRLDRTVAIKVLLAHVADDPDLRQRFEREAKTISSLNFYRSTGARPTATYGNAS